VRFLTSIEIPLLEIWVYPSILSILKTAFYSLGIVQSIGSSVKTSACFSNDSSAWHCESRGFVLLCLFGSHYVRQFGIR